MRKHLNPFVLYHELGEATAAAASEADVAEPAVDEELARKLDLLIGNLDLSVRASNCLEAAKIATVGQLVQLSEEELMQLRSFGRTSLIEVKRKLANLGLALAGDSLDQLEDDLSG